MKFRLFCILIGRILINEERIFSLNYRTTTINKTRILLNTLLIERQFFSSSSSLDENVK